MPEAIVYLAEGRTLEQRHRLLRGITDVMTDCLDVPPEVVVVQIVEVSKDNKSRAGVPMTQQEDKARWGREP